MKDWVFDTSQVKTFQTCEMKYYLKYVRGLEKQSFDDSNVDITFGKYFHVFLEEFYKWMKDKSYKPKQIEEIWADFPVFPGQLVKTKDAGIFMCKQYLRRWKEQDSNIEILAVEETIDFMIGDYPYTVKCDLVYRQGENVYGLEHKTTGRLGYNYFGRYFIDAQVSAQTYAIKQKYGECSGIFINACEISFLQKAKLLEIGAKDQHNYSNTERKYSSYYKQDMIYAKGHTTSFARDLQDRNPDELTDWYKNCEHWLKRLCGHKEMGVWLKSDGGSACTMFRGCTMKEICKTSVGLELDAEIIEALYVEKEDPLDYLEREGKNDTTI